MSTRKSTPDFSFRSTSDSTVPGTSLPGLIALASAAILILSGCAGTSAIPHPTAKNVEYAGRNGQVTSISALKVGRKLYIGRCSSCHSLTKPGALTPADWPEMVARMADNAKINPDQQRAITQYLVSISAAVHDTASVPAAAIGSPSKLSNP